MPAELGCLKNTKNVGCEKRGAESTLNCLSIAVLGEETPIREIVHIGRGAVATICGFEAMIARENASTNS